MVNCRRNGEHQDAQQEPNARGDERNEEWDCEQPEGYVDEQLGTLAHKGRQLDRQRECDEKAEVDPLCTNQRAGSSAYAGCRNHFRFDGQARPISRIRASRAA